MVGRKKVSRRATSGVRKGEELLAELDAFKLTMESGKTVRIDLRKETDIPLDPVHAAQQLAVAPARLLFWAHQEERALYEVRSKETALSKLEGEAYVTQHKYVDEHTTDLPTPSFVNARVACLNEVDSMKKDLASARKRYGVIRALRISLDHRVRALQRITAQHAATLSHS